MEETTKLIINMLDIGQLLRIKKQCESYITYTIDHKQFNEKFGIKTNQKTFGELLEYVEGVLIFKQFEQKESGGIKTESIKSTMTEDTKKTKKEKEKQ